MSKIVQLDSPTNVVGVICERLSIKGELKVLDLGCGLNHYGMELYHKINDFENINRRCLGVTYVDLHRPDYMTQVMYVQDFITPLEIRKYELENNDLDYLDNPEYREISENLDRIDKLRGDDIFYAEYESLSNLKGFDTLGLDVFNQVVQKVIPKDVFEYVNGSNDLGGSNIIIISKLLNHLGPKAYSFVSLLIQKITRPTFLYFRLNYSGQSKDAKSDDATLEIRDLLIAQSDDIRWHVEPSANGFHNHLILTTHVNT